MSNSLDPDQDLHPVGPDLGPNCFAKLISRRQKSPLAGKNWINQEGYERKQLSVNFLESANYSKSEFKFNQEEHAGS